MVSAAEIGRRIREFRRLMACVVLLVFAFQSYALQTHIHARAIHSGVSSPAPASGREPVGNSQMECPLCQAVAHDGIFLEPAVVLAAVFGAGWLLAVPQAHVARLPGVAAHTWKSRAPPRL
jgi:hypothetical protein